MPPPTPLPRPRDTGAAERGWDGAIRSLTIELGLADPHDDDGHGELGSLQWGGGKAQNLMVLLPNAAPSPPPVLTSPAPTRSWGAAPLRGGGVEEGEGGSCPLPSPLRLPPPSPSTAAAGCGRTDRHSAVSALFQASSLPMPALRGGWGGFGPPWASGAQDHDGLPALGAVTGTLCPGLCWASRPRGREGHPVPGTMTGILPSGSWWASCAECHDGHPVLRSRWAPCLRGHNGHPAFGAVMIILKTMMDTCPWGRDGHPAPRAVMGIPCPVAPRAPPPTQHHCRLREPLGSAQCSWSSTSFRN